MNTEAEQIANKIEFVLYKIPLIMQVDDNQMI